MKASAAWLIFVLSFSCVAVHRVEARPNFVLVMADDLGYETIGANGGTSYHTPVLDGLATTGARFTHCFVQPLCTPTRCQMMTGRYNVRNYTDFGELIPREVTFGNLLQQAGYRTCIVGKWQLGHDVSLPQHFGFEESCLWQHTRRPPRYTNPGLEVNGKEIDYSHGEYGPDLVADYALDFMSRHKSEPFFLYYPMILTHAPYQPTPDSDSWDPTTTGTQENRNKRHFSAMVAYMDKLVGRLVSHLDELGLRENTLVLFVGDNGTGHGVRSQLDGSEVLGGKGLTTAAGMHVPLIVNWPGHVEPRVCTKLVDSTDFLPTLLAAAGVTAPDTLELDGVSFLPQLLGQRGVVRQWIYSWYCPRPHRNPAIHEFAFNHKYKLYRSGDFFDIETDPLEHQPQKVDALSGEAARAANELQSAIDRYREARPADLSTDP